MNKQEFYDRTNAEAISEEDWDIINTVYAYHPMISDVEGKDEIAALYKKGGLGLLTDMFGTADEIRCRESNIQMANVELEKIENQFKKDLKEVNAKYTEAKYIQSESNRMNIGEIENLRARYIV